MSRLERRAVASLALLYAFRMLGLFMLLPVLALYASQYDLSTPVLVGLALGIYGLSQAALQIPLGMLSDRLGRKPIIIAGLLLFIIGGLLSASADNIFEVIVGRMLQGAGAIASTLTAMLADLTREQHRSKAMAAIGGSIGLAFMVAMITGPMLASQFGISGLFLVTALLGVVGLLITIFVVPSVAVQTSEPSARPLFGMLGDCLRDPALMRLNVGVFSLHAALMAIFVVVPSQLEQFGLGRDQHWQLYLPVMLLSFILMLPLMIYSERAARQREMFLLVIAFVALSMFGAAALPGSVLIVAAMLLVFFFGFNYLEATLPSLLTRTVYAGGKGTATGVYSSFQFLGAFFGGTLGGWISGRWGSTAVFWAAMLLGLLWLAIAWSMTAPIKTESLTLTWQLGQWNASRLRAEVLSLPGTLDMTIFEDQRLAYLRVIPEFNRECLPLGIEQA